MNTKKVFTQINQEHRGILCEFFHVASDDRITASCHGYLKEVKEATPEQDGDFGGITITFCVPLEEEEYCSHNKLVNMRDRKWRVTHYERKFEWGNNLCLRIGLYNITQNAELQYAVLRLF